MVQIIQTPLNPVAGASRNTHILTHRPHPGVLRTSTGSQTKPTTQSKSNGTQQNLYFNLASRSERDCPIRSGPFRSPLGCGCRLAGGRNRRINSSDRSMRWFLELRGASFDLSIGARIAPQPCPGFPPGDPGTGSGWTNFGPLCLQRCCGLVVGFYDNYSLTARKNLPLINLNN